MNFNCGCFQVSILVSDINDNTPTFQSSLINLTLSESLEVGTPVLNLVATDGDFGNNGAIIYEILSEVSDATGLVTGGIIVFM